MARNRKQTESISVDNQLHGQICQISESKGKENNMTHNQGVDGSSPSGPTVNQTLTRLLVGVFFYTPVWRQDLTTKVREIATYPLL